jgi:hypothetical protein
VGPARAGAAILGEPGALQRGGDFNDTFGGGPLAVFGVNGLSDADDVFGFRCAR